MEVQYPVHPCESRVCTVHSAAEAIAETASAVSRIAKLRLETSSNLPPHKSIRAIDGPRSPLIPQGAIARPILTSSIMSTAGPSRKW